MRRHRLLQQRPQHLTHINKIKKLHYFQHMTQTRTFFFKQIKINQHNNYSHHNEICVLNLYNFIFLFFLYMHYYIYWAVSSIMRHTHNKTSNRYRHTRHNREEGYNITDWTKRSNIYIDKSKRELTNSNKHILC